ncbi:Dystroglycan-type cadherin domain protein [Ferrimonas balearica DSM 9799]|uniref:Dystroglycan-type cadherin domain protein n=1 Tax=Ferrimonas balearica (strain DSM 9799 / CCM 4581 / KCTC 23876 / PAT) TaxID=550540 RepID=E1STX2_FERBD|nr:tandem-95 repeat protein [Ferrimonas balearica]ADN77216.1 Dystroglycan-type cadherin domain protein [Ferrimonas balearica DSM 9799]
MRYPLLASAVLLALTGCGSGSDSDSGNTPDPTPQPTPNTAPTLSLSQYTTAEDTPFSLSLADLVSDVDGDNISLSVEACGDQLSCQLSGTTLTLTPADDYHGEQSVRLSASDGEASTSAELTLTVEAVNDAPLLAVSDQQVEEDGSLTLDLASWISDVDGDALTLSVASCAANIDCALDNTSLTLTPAADHFGDSHSIGLTVTDAANASTSASFNLTVSGVNDAPQWQAIAAQTLQYDQSLTLDLTRHIADADNDSLSFSVVSCDNLQCQLNGSELTLSAPAEAGVTYPLTLRATDGSDEVDTALQVAITKVPVDAIAGVQFFPPYNGLTGVDNVTLSLHSEQDLTQLTINGEVITLENPRQWQQNFPLQMGDTLFTVVLETATETLSLTKTVRYQGDLHQGSADLTYLGDRTVLVDDYRAGALVAFDLDTRETTAYPSDRLTGMNIDFLDWYVALDSERLLGSAWDQDAAANKLVEVNLTDLTITERYNLSNVPVQVSHLTASTDASLVYFVFDNSRQDPNTGAWYPVEEFYQFEVATNTLTLLADTAQVDDDGPLTRVRGMILDETNDRLLMVNQNYSDPAARLLALPLSGPDEGRLVELTPSSDPGCLDFAAQEYYELRNVRDGKWLMVMQNDNWASYQLDINTLCLTEHHRVPESLLLNRESLQGIDVNPLTGEILLGFYPGPIVYQPETDSYRGAEAAGFAGEPWNIQEPTAIHYRADTHQIVYGDDQFLMQLDLQTGEVTQLAQLRDNILKLEWDEASQRYYLYDEYDGLLAYDVAGEQLVTLVEEASGQHFSYPALASDGQLYYVDSDVLNRINPETLEINTVSPHDDAAGFRSITSLHLDEPNNRAIISVSSGGDTTYIGLDLDSGVRTILLPESDLNDGDYNILSADGSLMWYFDWANDQVMSLNLDTQAITPVTPASTNHYKLGDPTGLFRLSDDILLMGDDDFGGFWMINLTTDEKLLYR